MRSLRAAMPPTFSLPMINATADSLTRNFWAQFMHELRLQTDASAGSRIQKAIFATALYTRSTPEAVARVLVENGLSAQRACFPAAFVAQLETRRSSPKWHVKAITAQQRALLELWDRETRDYKPALRCH